MIKILSKIKNKLVRKKAASYRAKFRVRLGAQEFQVDITGPAVDSTAMLANKLKAGLKAAQAVSQGKAVMPQDMVKTFEKAEQAMGRAVGNLEEALRRKNGYFNVEEHFNA